jgi:hypothetical protein
MAGDFTTSDVAPRRLRTRIETFELWLAGKGVDFRTIKLLQSIDVKRQQVVVTSDRQRSPFWLLPFRNELRWAIRKGHLPTIKYYARVGPIEMGPVAVWLWGRCADRFRLYGLQHLRHDPSPQLRKHVAKALRRVEAWAWLDEMARSNPGDAKIQYFARSRTSQRPFRERLSNYVQSVDDSHADEVTTPSRMQFWASEKTWEYTPPKSRELIRRMLRRIRHWVRWGAM